MRQINVCKNFPVASYFVYRVEAYVKFKYCVENLSKALFGVHLHRWIATYPMDKVIHSLNNWARFVVK